MSREELGDAVVDRVAGERTPILAVRRPLAPLPGAGTSPATWPDPAEREGTTGRQPEPGAAPGPGRHARLVALLVVTTLSAAVGFTGTRAWDDAKTGEISLDSDPVAWAGIVDVRPAGGVARTVVDLSVRLTNLGRVPITLSGSETTADAGAIESISPDGQRIQPGHTSDVQVHASVDCASPQPLRMYPLHVRRSDRTLHSIEISGGTAALTQVCESQPVSSHVLVLTGIDEDDGHLRLTVSSPTGRTTQVTRIRAGGVTLVSQPLRGSFDAQARAIWIPRPRTCPAEWLRNGIPRTVVVDVDAGGPATVALDVGYALARWLRAGPCSGDAS